MTKKKTKLKVIGKTSNGKLVLQGCFVFVSTKGLPLDILFLTLQNRKYVIDWIDFCDAAISDGWNIATLFSKLNVALFDVYGLKYRDNVIATLKKLYVM